METEFQLFTIETADRADVISAVAASLSTRGVNIECFLANEGGGEPRRRRGKFVVIVEADEAYAMVLKKTLKSLDVVYAVSDPLALTAKDLVKWKRRFAQLSEDCQAAADDVGVKKAKRN